MTEANRLGRRGERIAGRWLMRRGWRVLDRNLRVGQDEIDIVAQSPDSSVVAFIEVKTSTGISDALLMNRVDGGKRDRLRRSARRLASHYPNQFIRIDLITVTLRRWHQTNVSHWPDVIRS